MSQAVQSEPRRRSFPFEGLAVVAVWLALGAVLLVMDRPPHISIFAFVLVGWLLSVMAHEFGHALVGYWAGDHTVKAKGYLEFNPRHYADPMTSIAIPLLALALGGIAFPGGAVYLRSDLMRSRLWRAAASLAGPAVTAAILLGLALALRLWANFGAESELYPAVSVLAFLQAMALILNLLPIPGLDGFNAIRPFLPKAWGPAIRKLQGLSMVLLLVLVFVVPGASAGLVRGAASLSVALGLQPEALQYGWDAFHFWR
ncbi:MAG: site-2 protease family protein [Caulobacteraceae bacterium]